MNSINIAFILAAIGIATARGCGPKPCSWRTCQATYDPDFTPGVSQGTCITQVRRVYHNYQTNNGQGSCPESTSCGEGDIVRTWCSCRRTICTLGAFGPWQQLDATQEYRERHVDKTAVFNEQPPPCAPDTDTCTPVREVRPKEIRCSSVPAIDFGVLIGESCAGGASSYLNAKCRLACNNGRTLQGNDVITCQAGGWSSTLGRCERIA